MKITIERSDDYQGALRHIVLAQSSDNPLEELLTARSHLVKILHEVREVYIEQANNLLVEAGAKGEIEMVELISESEILGDEPDNEEEDEEDYEGKSKGPVGFQPNQTKITGD